MAKKPTYEEELEQRVKELKKETLKRKQAEKALRENEEKESLKTAMKNSISEVLEKMFYLPLYFSEDSNVGELLNSGRGEIIVSKLNFSGPFSGWFLFFVPKELAHSITADFMGIDEDSLSQDQVTETVKEIINMVTGNIFSIFDDQVVFDLGIPELIDFEKAKRDISESEEKIFITINTLDNHLALGMVKT